MSLGVAWAALAGLAWGLVFVVPVLLPQYPAALLSAGRYLAFGLIALPLAWIDRHALRRLGAADWRAALRLALVGNLLYYLCLAAAIQRAGVPLPTVIVGCLPVVIAVTSNLRANAHGAALPWRRLLPALALIGAGIALVHHAEFEPLARAGDSAAAQGRFASGALLAVGAVACWTWYPLRNAAWLRAHPAQSARAWATAQGLATLPLAALAGLAWWTAAAWSAAEPPSPLGPDPLRFVALMLATGLVASWLGTACWNAASRRLRDVQVGPLIVFETLAALAYAHALRGTLPAPATWAGVSLLLVGVVAALRVARPRGG